MTIAVDMGCKATKTNKQKHPPETNNNFEYSYLKSISFLVKNKTFYNIPIKIKIFCNKNNIGLKYFADIRFGMFLVKIDRQK